MTSRVCVQPLGVKFASHPWLLHDILLHLDSRLGRSGTGTAALRTGLDFEDREQVRQMGIIQRDAGSAGICFWFSYHSLSFSPFFFYLSPFDFFPVFSFPYPLFYFRRPCRWYLEGNGGGGLGHIWFWFSIYYYYRSASYRSHRPHMSETTLTNILYLTHNSSVSWKKYKLYRNLGSPLMV